ncbi:DUF2510 domain-containing protein [Rhodococcus sp. PvR099]|uniref:DUF2510 domain-containing protein n=1 Tax=Rhodococcus sp. PvR099 TaxID=2806602 RepID=UPI001AE8424A|nr:DUF2510 domain-containing protein [Rhodococcus sp. PvR099]MBP1160240.1 multidrug efflux pump subunit AcrA (membrane-fusion protein) [Rhodococcus sp. PvR099]
MSLKINQKSTLAVAAIAVAIALTGCGTPTTEGAASAATSTTEARKTVSPQEAEAKRQADAAAAKARQEAAAAEAARVQALEAAKKDPATYEQLSERDFALIAKNPGSATGRKVVVYGRVTQFDAATGTTQFLARTAPFAGDKYDYDQNTFVVGDTAALIANVVEDDLVTMYTEVLGSYTYDTQAGGSTTVPKLQVNIIEVTGSA